MAINRAFLGRAYPAPEPYEVTRGKIREFAEAVGDANPLYSDPATARDEGHPDVVAPPTFPIVLGMAGAGRAVTDPELGLDFSMVVHGEQRFRYTRPVRAGDLLDAVTRITDIRSVAGNELVTLESEITDPDGAHVVTAVNMLVVRGAAQDGGPGPQDAAKAKEGAA
ncbi:MaoC family dehydratase N-terminal domain-containing protein [Nocardiopsis chromatogenes]|uniref:MaoC family dehydratase N-terminal domain-containing protein n=1 Tax=Nocardiopsis chromatogenes TaxID=280239 RepID=UPI0003485888|nr:MaoC family dehydratase N-terminal domain-containing protein [Nocardiopsis chromatogenes]